VHITELGGEYYRFDEARQELRGERSGVRYAVGARLRVQVSRVDLDSRKIDFRLVREGEERGAPRPGKDRDRRAERSSKPQSAQDELAAVQLADREIKATARAGKSGGRPSRKAGGSAAGQKVSLKAQQSAGRAAKRRK